MKSLTLGTSFAVATLLTACGGGGHSDSAASTSRALAGSGVKGPLAGAQVALYRLDPSDPLGHGAELGSGRTDAHAAITGLSIGTDVQGPVLVEVLAGPNTVDLTTGGAPAISRLITLRDAADLRAEGAVYPTPLSTMAVELALRNGDRQDGGYSGNGDGTTSQGEVMAALPLAVAQVKAAFGFGLLDGQNILTAPPLLTSQTDTPARRQAVLDLRTAVEAVVAIAGALKEGAQTANAGSPETTESMFEALVSDLSDGAVDGKQGGVAIDAFADVADIEGTVTQDPATLTIPGSSLTVAQMKQVLSNEVADTGADTQTDLGDIAAQPGVANPLPDSDGDQVPDRDDAFPLDPGEYLDTDNDGIGNNADNDDDNDGLSDRDELAAGSDPLVADSDGDGVIDGDDAFPIDPTETLDTDGDGIGNNADTDDDGDGTPDGMDAFPLNPSEDHDVDGDGIGANADPDDNNPCVPDVTAAGCQGTNQPAVWDQFKWNQANWQ